jgi:hypothetical protein
VVVVRVGRCMDMSSTSKMTLVEFRNARVRVHADGGGGKIECARRGPWCASMRAVERSGALQLLDAPARSTGRYRNTAVIDRIYRDSGSKRRSVMQLRTEVIIMAASFYDNTDGGADYAPGACVRVRGRTMGAL